MPYDLTGMNKRLMCQYIEYVADHLSMNLIGERIYKVENPFPWMSEAIDLNKEKNFFETRVTEYQSGGVLAWD